MVSFLWDIPGSKTAGPNSNSMFNFLRNCQTVFQKWCTILYPHESMRRKLDSIFAFSVQYTNESGTIKSNNRAHTKVRLVRKGVLEGSCLCLFFKRCGGQPRWLSGLAPAFGLGHDPGVPHWASWMEPASPSASVVSLPLSLSVSLMDK